MNDIEKLIDLLDKEFINTEEKNILNRIIENDPEAKK